MHNRWHLLAAVAVVLGCRPQLDDANAPLAVPATLPGFAALPSPPAALTQSRLLTDQGRDLLAKGQLKPAVAKLTEALTTCPADSEARLELARAFARNGRSSVAIKLLAPAKDQRLTCGACLRMLQSAGSDPAFAHLRETAEGAELLAGVSDKPIPFAAWAIRFGKALQSGDPQQTLQFVHSELPYELLRSCPTCDNEAARPVQRQTLSGLLPAAKLTQRFDTVHPEMRGIPLDVPADVTCTGDCCDFVSAKPPQPNRALLQRACFWPVAPDRGAITTIALQYGRAEN